MELADLYNSEYFQVWDSDNRSTGNCGIILSDPDRFDRMYEAAENGAEGSTHAEIIQDWRDCLNTMQIIDPDENNSVSDIENGIILESDYNWLMQDIDEVEKWHENAGSLHLEIG